MDSDAYSESFLQVKSKSNLRMESSMELQMGNGMSMMSAAQVAGIRKMEANDMDKFKFGDGRWVCEDGGLPPKIQNPNTYLWNDRGYIVFPKAACTGGAFDSQCYCWDNAKWL